MDAWSEALVVVVTVCARVCAGLGRCPCSWSLKQTPATVSSTPGSPVNITCSFQPPPEAIRLRVIWRSAETLSTDCRAAKVLNFTVISANQSEQQDPDGLVHEVLTLSSAPINTSRVIFCMVYMEIPELEECCSNGTVVTSVPPPPGQEAIIPEEAGLSWWAWVSVAGGSTVALTAALSIFICSRRRRRRRKADELVYANFNPLKPTPGTLESKVLPPRDHDKPHGPRPNGRTHRISALRPADTH